MIESHFSKLVLLTAIWILPSAYVKAQTISCASLYKQTDLQSSLTEFFIEDPVEFAKLKNETRFPGIVDSIEKSLNKQYTSYFQRIVIAEKQPFIVINTEGSSLVNKIAKEVFNKWQIVVSLNPNFPTGALGAYQGLNGKSIKGVMMARTFDDPRFLSNMYHEFMHAHLSNYEFQGRSHPFSLYFYRNPEVSYDGIQYGRYLPTQEFATFLMQGLVHAESAKSLDLLYQLTRIVSEFKSLGIVEKPVFKTIKGYEAVGLKTLLGEFYVPKKELQTNKIAPEQYENYITEKINKMILIADTIRDVIKPIIEDLGGGIVTLKSGLSEQESRDYLIQIRKALFEKYPDIKEALSEYNDWTESFWRNHVLKPN